MRHDLYIEARYPGELGLLPGGKPTLANARELADVAKLIYNQVEHELAGRDDQ